MALVGLLTACGVSTSQAPTPVASPPPTTTDVTLTVSAAASLNQVFPKVAQLWEQETGNKVTVNLGSTAQLAQQIERGAPVDLFMAADKKSIERLEKEGLILSETKALYGVGRLTLWQKEGSTLELTGVKDLTKPDIKRVAIANPDLAPYGIAAREALQTAGVWDALQPKLVLGENIRQTQQYVETGNVEVAIVALANSVNQPGKWVLLPAELHKPLEQMLAVPKSAPHPEAAKEFAAFINGEKGRPLMRKYGFVLPGEQLQS
ncbi:Molybdenum ABC transporter, substrate-binding protein ModA [uncultured Leptolyngbya sp.]|uniref:Molybdenum ABC transporter, substrate-binding protein ModA n=1 Tax=uncultured Leptolyngbya sp. TaxID=332963 RepID=A0A6J4L672_9CYAN|nr:Molybdenum ABC transporter, substrate-binding protein ModA [uncultured Leptolyngbya sp.]